MSNVCCKELKGWCKAFTWTERLLTILEAILLGILIALLIFVIVHLIVCPEPATPEKHDHTETKLLTTVAPAARQTFPPSTTCTWKMSKKTSAATHYYYTTRQGTSTTGQETTTTGQETTSNIRETTSNIRETTSNIRKTTISIPANNTFEHIVKFSEESDGEESPESYERFILALVKFGPSRDVTFGCILTTVNYYWAVTAASCVNAIELGDSLDAYVMVERYGAGRGGRRHFVADAQEHPRYGGAAAGFDLVALRSGDRLLTDATQAVKLPTLIDYYLTTIGENFTVLGFGRFRTEEEGPGPRRLRYARVWSLPRAQCPAPRPAPAPAWAARHLARGRALDSSPCGIDAGALCCGVRYTRGLPCNYCAGTPLLGPDADGGEGGEGRGDVLYGVMSDSRQCGEACEPALYVNIAAVRDWLDAVIAE